MSAVKVNNQIRFVLLGPPGAGKGTQAVLLAKAFRFLHISTGDMLREAAKGKDELAKEVRLFMAKGELVSDEIVTRIVIERMAKPDASYGVILDGFPRTRAQAESLDRSLQDKGLSLSIVLYFNTSEKVAVQRLSGRRVCPSCNKNYHLTNIPPKKDGICDVCNISLVHREDDKPETIKKRLLIYKQSTEDLINYYREKDLLEEVDGDLSAEVLFKKIANLFKQKLLADDDSNE